MRDLTNIKYWVFDLDNTLYPAEINLFSQVDRKMGEFIADYFSLPYEEAKAIQKKYFREHGTTLRGLMTEHQVTPDDFLSYVHDIDFSILQKDNLLAEALTNLPGKKVVYTNASADYAGKVMNMLGIDHIFEGIFDIHLADYNPKPDPSSYVKMIDHLGVDPSQAIMAEDIAKNLIPARDMGMQTLWVQNDLDWSKDGSQDLDFDHVVTDLAAWLTEVAKG